MIFAACALIVDTTVSFWLIPWNTSLSAALIWSLIAVGGRLVAFRAVRPTLGVSFLFGFLAGSLPVARPADLIVAIAAMAGVAICLASQRRLSCRWIIGTVIGSAVLPLIYITLHLFIYGPHTTPYMVESARHGFAFNDIGWKSYVLLVDASPWYPDSQSLLERLPWLVLGAAGLILIAARGKPEHRRIMILFGAMALPYILLFLAYTDLQPPGLWRFNNAHYFKWLFPAIGLGVWFWIKAALDSRTRIAAVVTLVIVTLPTGIRLTPVAAGEDQPARLLMFRGRTDRDWDEAYFAPSRITDRLGTLTNIYGFHQLPDPRGERAIAIARLFAAHPRRTDPGEAPPFASDDAPYARYAERVSVGLPCWIPQLACRLPGR